MARRDASSHKQEMMEEHLSLSIKELMETKLQLKYTQSNLKHEVEKIKSELRANQLEAKTARDELLQKLTATEKELNATKQQLATTCQAEKQHTPLAASNGPEMEMKLQQKMKHMEGILQNHWLTFLNHRFSINPIVVKMTEFAKNKITTWTSQKFHVKDQELIQLQVAPSKIGSSIMSVSLLSDTLKRNTGTFMVKLLNQISDSEHYLGPEKKSNPQAKKSVLLQYDNFISYQDLHKITPTSQYLKDDILFFEVLKT